MRRPTRVHECSIYLCRMGQIAIGAVDRAGRPNRPTPTGAPQIFAALIAIGIALIGIDVVALRLCARRRRVMVQA
jgi:hypothetical protein